jgi:hypothetical protein
MEVGRWHERDFGDVDLSHKVVAMILSALYSLVLQLDITYSPKSSS